MRQQNVETICNEGCGKVFELQNVKTVKLLNEIEKNYFNCPYCNREYVGFYTNIKTRELQKDMRELRRQLNATSKKMAKVLLAKETLLRERLAQSLVQARAEGESLG